jgi:putative glycerol-1-phosphate prenyltransferase
MIEKVKENISIPLIVGGGIKTPQQVNDALSAGANLVVVGNALEENPLLLTRS